MFREIRRTEKITDRNNNNQVAPGFDPDKRIVVGTNNGKEEAKVEKTERFDPDRRV